MYKKFLVIMLSISLSACNNIFKTEYGNILDKNDLIKTCYDLENELYIINKKIKKIKTKKRIFNGKNMILYAIALPTAFMSLFFLDSTDEIMKEKTLLNYRMNHLTDLYQANDCQET